MPNKTYQNLLDHRKYVHDTTGTDHSSLIDDLGGDSGPNLDFFLKAHKASYNNDPNELSLLLKNPSLTSKHLQYALAYYHHLIDDINVIKTLEAHPAVDEDFIKKAIISPNSSRSFSNFIKEHKLTNPHVLIDSFNKLSEDRNDWYTKVERLLSDNPVLNGHALKGLLEKYQNHPDENIREMIKHVVLTNDNCPSDILSQRLDDIIANEMPGSIHLIDMMGHKNLKLSPEQIDKLIEVQDSKADYGLVQNHINSMTDKQLCDFIDAIRDNDTSKWAKKRMSLLNDIAEHRNKPASGSQIPEEWVPKAIEKLKNQRAISLDDADYAIKRTVKNHLPPSSDYFKKLLDSSDEYDNNIFWGNATTNSISKEDLLHRWSQPNKNRLEAKKQARLLAEYGVHPTDIVNGIENEEVLRDFLDVAQDLPIRHRIFDALVNSPDLNHASLGIRMADFNNQEYKDKAFKVLDRPEFSSSDINDYEKASKVVSFILNKLAHGNDVSETGQYSNREHCYAHPDQIAKLVQKGADKIGFSVGDLGMYLYNVLVDKNDSPETLSAEDKQLRDLCREKPYKHFRNFMDAIKASPNPKAEEDLVASFLRYRKGIYPEIQQDDLQSFMSHPNPKIRIHFANHFTSSLKGPQISDLIDNGWGDKDRDKIEDINYQEIDPSLLNKIYQKGKEKALDPVNHRTALASLALSHPDLPPEIREDALNTPSSVLNSLAIETLPFSESELHLLKKRKDYKGNLQIASTIDRKMKQLLPDKKYKKRVSGLIGAGKLRKIRDFILSRNADTKILHPKEVSKYVPGDWSKFRDKHGMISADLIQQYLDTAAPHYKFNIKKTVYDEPMQRHNKEDSKVVQFDITNDHAAEMDKHKVRQLFNNIIDDCPGVHPNNANSTVGWVRWTGSPKTGIFIDEVQSDLSHLKHSKSPKDRKLYQILFGDKNATHVLHEAFLQHLRDSGHAGCKVSIHDTALKSKISLAHKDQAPPVHIKLAYTEEPQKMGYEPGTYSKDRMPTMDSEEYRGEPTWDDTLRKFLDGDELSDQEFAILKKVL